PDGVCERLPVVLQPMVNGYDQVFLEMQRRQVALAERVERYSFMELHSEDIVMQIDAKGLVKYVSAAILTHLGYTPDEMQGIRILELLHPGETDYWIDSLKDAARSRRPVLLEGNWRHKDGRYVSLEMSLRHAYGLNGRVAETIAMARNVAARNELPFVLFLFDLDRFKQVNDSLGHSAGDDYLIETANRVRSILRPGDSLARMGGDEFVALFDGVATEGGARSIASRIIDAVSQPYSCHGALLHPKTSIGIVLCDDPELASDELISRADRAMYAAKIGRASCRERGE